MILHTRKGENGRKIARFVEPIRAAGSGWNNEIGHYLSFGPFEGNDGVAYTITLTAADIDKIGSAWTAEADRRAQFDTELNGGPIAPSPKLRG